MTLTHKDDWEDAKRRLLLWWNHEYFGRCGLAVTAPRQDAPDAASPPEALTPEQRWYDLDWISRCNSYHLGRTYYGGEAIPVWNAGYSGVSAIPTFLGCPIDIDMATGWWHPVLTAPDALDVGGLDCGLRKNCQTADALREAWFEGLPGGAQGQSKRDAVDVGLPALARALDATEIEAS